jgi:hypothetical protein
MQRFDALQQLAADPGIIFRRRRRAVHPDVEESFAR